MEELTLNHLAVLTAALSTFLLGALWWSPIMFGKAWMQENGFTEEDLKKGNMAKIFGLSFIFTLIMAYNLAFFLGDDSIDWKMGSIFGLLTGLGWISMAVFVLGLFERKSWRYMLINASYYAVAFTIMGIIIGLWR